MKAASRSHRMQLGARILSVSIVTTLAIFVIGAPVQAAVGRTAGDARPAARAATHAGGNLTVVVPSEPRSLDVDVDNNSATGQIAAEIVQNLVASNPNNYRANFTGLITAWKQTTPLTWEFTVRHGISFSNGEPFNAYVAAWDLTHEVQANNSTTGPYVSAVSSAVAKNNAKMIVTTTKPIPFLPQVMTVIQALPPHYFLKVGQTQFGRNPVGTGPFLLQSWTPGQSIVLVPNPHYNGSHPKVSSVTFNFASQDTTRVNLLATGAADIATNLPVATSSGQGYSVQKVPTSFVMKIEFNIHQPPFNDVRVRRAVAMAINRPLLVTSIFGAGGAVPYENLLAPVFPSAGHHGKQYITYNPDAARSLLKQIGNVPPIDFYWTNGHYVLDNLVGQAIVGMLQAVGFTVNEHPMETGAFFNLLLTNNMPGMHMLGNTLGFFAEPGTFLVGYVTGATLNYCVDGSIDAIYNKAVVLPYGPTRNALYNQAEGMLLTKTVCPVPLYIQKVAFGVSNQVTGFKGDYVGSWTSLLNLTLKP